MSAMLASLNPYCVIYFFLSGKCMHFLFIHCSKIGRRLILGMISEMHGPVMKQVFRSSPFIELLRKCNINAH